MIRPASVGMKPTIGPRTDCISPVTSTAASPAAPGITRAKRGARAAATPSSPMISPMTPAVAASARPPSKNTAAEAEARPKAATVASGPCSGGRVTRWSSCSPASSRVSRREQTPRMRW